MVESFTRWTAPCGCVFELISDPDSPNEADRANRFGMCDYICPKHEPQRTKQLTNKHPAHKNKSDKIMQIIEQTKQRNIQGHVNALSKHKPGSFIHRQLQDLLPNIQRHNSSIHSEWTELTNNDHAFDENIYNIVLKEHQDPSAVTEANGEK